MANRDLLAEARSAPTREALVALWQIARDLAGERSEGKRGPNADDLAVMDAIARLGQERFPSLDHPPTASKGPATSPSASRSRPDRSTPWRVAVFCDAATHDPGARPRVLTAEHAGHRQSDWRLTFHGGHLQVINSHGKRVDTRNWDATTRVFHGQAEGHRLRAVILCRDCGREEKVAYAASLIDALEECRERAKRNARLSSLITDAQELLADEATAR